MTIETLTPQLSLYVRPRKIKPPQWSAEKHWTPPSDKAMSLKQSTNPGKHKKYSLKGMKMVIQACGLFGSASQRVHVQKPKMVDIATQTDDIFIPTPRNYSKKIENVYCTPETNRLQPVELLTSSTPFRMDTMQMVVNKINLDLENKQKLINALTPKRNILLDRNNFSSPVALPTPKTLNTTFNNVTPVSSQKWRSTYATPSSGKQKPLHRLTPKQLSPASPSKFYKIIGKTREFQKKYAIATVKLFKDACYWFRSITKCDNVDNVVMNNANVVPSSVAAPKNEVARCVEMFQILREEIQEVKNMVKELRKQKSGGFEERTNQVKTENIPIVTMAPSIPAPPPPPPPPMAPMAPPPPPPPMPFLLASTNSLPKLAKKGNNEKKETKSDGSRPAICLEDILKVKLRKPCDRSQSLPKSAPRRSSTPVVTMDVLKQVRLRPVASTNSLPSRGSDNGSDSSIGKTSNSPMSNLKRLLTNRPYSEHRPRRMRHTVKRANAIVNQER